MTAATHWAGPRFVAVEAELDALREAADAEDRDFTDDERRRFDELHAERRAILDGDPPADLDVEASDPDANEEPLPLVGQSAADLRRQIEYSTEGPGAATLRDRLEADLARARHETSPGDHLRLLEQAGPRSRDELLSIASHEAGHAVVGEELGCRVTSVRFTFDGGIGGATLFEVDPTPVAIAAGAAFARAAGFSNRRGDTLSSVDRQLLARAGCRDRHHQELAIQAAVGILARPGVFSAVGLVASELLAEGELPGARVRHILQQETIRCAPRP